MKHLLPRSRFVFLAMKWDVSDCLRLAWRKRSDFFSRLKYFFGYLCRYYYYIHHLKRLSFCNCHFLAFPHRSLKQFVIIIFHVTNNNIVFPTLCGLLLCAVFFKVLAITVLRSFLSFVALRDVCSLNATSRPRSAILFMQACDSMSPLVLLVFNPSFECQIRQVLFLLSINITKKNKREKVVESNDCTRF